MLKVNFVSKQISVSEKNLLPVSQDFKSSLRHLKQTHCYKQFCTKTPCESLKGLYRQKNKCLDGLRKVFTKTAHPLNILRYA